MARTGRDVTVVAYGPTVRVALDAATVAQGEGRSLEVIDLRSLSPLDYGTLVKSVRKTGRVVIVHEAPTYVAGKDGWTFLSDAFISNFSQSLGRERLTRAEVSGISGMGAAAHLQPQSMSRGEPVRGGPQLEADRPAAVTSRIGQLGRQPGEPVADVPRTPLPVDVA